MLSKLFFTLFLLVVTTASNVLAYDCEAQVDGNWSNAATWTNCNDTIPQNGDNVLLNGHIITFDVGTAPRIPASGSIGAITSTGTAGQITVDISNAACSNSGACAIYADTITAGTKPTNAGVIYITGTTSNYLLINSNIIGGSNASAIGVNKNSSGTLTIIGDVTGGTGTSAYGYLTNATGTTNITGDITGGSTSSASAIYLNSAGTVNITGDVTGGSGGNAYGVYNVTNGTINITGDVYGGTWQASGTYNQSTTGTITVNGNLINSSNATSCSGKPVVWNPGCTNYMRVYADSDFVDFYKETCSNSAGGGPYAY